MRTFRGVINGRLEVQNDLRIKVFGDFNYMVKKQVDCFDEKGNFMFKHLKESFETESNKSDYIDNLYSDKLIDAVFQKNFKFYNLKMLGYSRLEELQMYDWNNVNSYIGYINEFNLVDKRHNLMYAKTHEFSIYGTKNYSVYHKLGKSILDFNYGDYTKRKNDFIKENPRLDWQVEYIYRQNLKIVANYFMCEVDFLKSKHFNMREQMIKRLMFNINNRNNERNTKRAY